MANKRLTISGYGQIETNNCVFRRTGAIEAQCALDATDFATAKAENGMLLAVDNLNRTIKFATDASLPIALNYSTEHIYDERTPGLKNFALGKDDFYPRLGYLTVGDKFTTNCIAYDNSEFAADSNLKTALGNYKTTTLYGGINSDGAIKVSASAPAAGPKLIVIDGNATMPDGTVGVKFQAVTV